MKHIILIILLNGCTFGMFAKRNYSKQVEEADAMYLQQRYEDALSGYGEVLKKRPKHKKLRLKFAKTLYRLKRYDDAYKVFKGFNPNSLDDEDNFEAGMSAFNKSDFKMASISFSYLKPNFRYYDVGCYYGGVASYNLGDHDVARQYFNKATVLPSRLMKNKRTYLFYMDNPPSKKRPEQPSIENDNPSRYDFLHQK